MTSSIDPLRRAARLRRATRAATSGKTRETKQTEGAGLPVPVDAPRTVPRAEAPPSAATFDAQLIGQDGQKRGLRAGAAAIDTAASSYNRIEWSGAKDRRSRKGRIAKTEV